MGISFLVLIVVIGLIVSLVVFSTVGRKRDGATELAPQPSMSKGVKLFALLFFALLIVSIVVVVSMLGQSQERSIEYTNQFTIECQDADIFLGYTYLGITNVSAHFRATDKYCFPLPSHPSLEQIETVVLASLPPGTEIIERDKSDAGPLQDAHRVHPVGIYTVRRPDGSVDEFLIVAIQAGDEAFGVLVRARLDGDFDMVRRWGGGGRARGTTGFLVKKSWSREQRRITLRMEPRAEGVTAWLDRFPEGTRMLKETP